MIIAPLLAALLSVSASAQTLACRSNEMTAAWEKINFGVWVTNYTIPDSSPRAATVSYQGCTADANGVESRTYGIEGGPFTVVALTNAGGDNGATTLILSRGTQWVTLGTWGHHKVFYKGVGIDKVAVPNGNDSTVVQNVFVIPVYDKR